MRKAHRYAAIFPMMPEGELHELADSISRNGQRDTIVLFGEEILEGRNRAKACEIAGVKPKERHFDPMVDGDPLTFVLDRNLHRRQLTASQRAAAAAEAFRLFEEKAKKDAEDSEDSTSAAGDGSGGDEASSPGRARDAAGEAFGVSGRSVADAKKLQESDPEAFEKVKAGDGTVSGALKKSRREQAVEALFEQIPELDKDKEFAEAIRSGRVLKTAAEIEAFGTFAEHQAAKLKPLLSKGWTVKKAAAYAFDELHGDSRLSDLVNKAIANGDQFSVVVSGFEISAQKVQSPKAEENAKA